VAAADVKVAVLLVTPDAAAPNATAIRAYAVPLVDTSSVITPVSKLVAALPLVLLKSATYQAVGRVTEPVVSVQSRTRFSVKLLALDI
jgi:hypothetical protein